MSICEWVWGHFPKHGKHTNDHILKMNDSPSSNNYQYLLSNEWYLQTICSIYTRILFFLILCRSCKDNHSCSKIKISICPCHVQETAFHNALPCYMALTFSLLPPSCYYRKLFGSGGFNINVLFRTKHSVFHA